MKQKIQIKKVLSVLFCIVLIAATALTITGCKEEAGTDSVNSDVVSEKATLSFTLTVTDADGNETTETIETEEKTVGAALLKKGIIEGEESEYGLYVKKVNGITSDYDTDGTYWAFYINGEYAQTGVDSTEITENAVYSLKIEK